jgi:hypothetical protein
VVCRHNNSEELERVLREKALQEAGASMVSAVAQCMGDGKRVRGGLQVGEVHYRAVAVEPVSVASTSPLDIAATKIQVAWRSYNDRRIYQYYRDLIAFR